MAALDCTWLEDSSLHERGCKSGTVAVLGTCKQAHSMRKSPDETSRDKGVGSGGIKATFNIDRKYAVWLCCQGSMPDCLTKMVVCTTVLDQSRTEKKNPEQNSCMLPKSAMTVIKSSLIPQSHPALVHIHRAVAEHVMYATSMALRPVRTNSAFVPS